MAVEQVDEKNCKTRLKKGVLKKWWIGEYPLVLE
jgi:hypothetical protein